MATFGELRRTIFREAGVRDHMQFIALGKEYFEFHREINAVEFKLGYSPEYIQSVTPEMCDMNLLSDQDFADWLERFRAILKR